MLREQDILKCLCTIGQFQHRQLLDMVLETSTEQFLVPKLQP